MISLEKQILDDALIFVNIYFYDKRISIQRYLHCLEDTLKRYETLNEKLIFISEIIRLEHGHINHSIEFVNEAETFTLQSSYCI